MQNAKRKVMQQFSRMPTDYVAEMGATGLRE